MAVYEFHGPLLDFVVRGRAVPQGSVKNFGRGKPSAYTNQKDLLPWREQIQHGAEAAIEKHLAAVGGQEPGLAYENFPLSGPLALECEFTMAKPASAPKTKRTYPITRPDGSKLLRAVEDALVAAGAMRDDAQLVYTGAWKLYPNETRRALNVPGVRVMLYRVAMYDLEEDFKQWQKA